MDTFVDYSTDMETKRTPTAPDITPGYPSKGKKLGPAWDAMWQKLTESGEFIEGRELAEEVAPGFGLEPATLVALISRAAQAGLLDKDLQDVEGARGMRSRSFYRIPVKDVS